MNDFLPKGYVPPESDLRFMALEEGANTFRVLSPAIVGYKWWIETNDTSRVPRRVRTDAEVPDEVRNAIDPRVRAKHFWAMSVYNYATQTIQMISKKIENLPPCGCGCGVCGQREALSKREGVAAKQVSPDAANPQPKRS